MVCSHGKKKERHDEMLMLGRANNTTWITVIPITLLINALGRAARPSSPARQISVEGRPLQSASQLIRSSSASMRSHGNPYIDEPMWPFRAETCSIEL